MKQIRHVTCNGLKNPLGINRGQVCFSWRIEGDQQNIYQRSYRIQVWQEEGGLVWDSGSRETDCCLYIPYQGEALMEKSLYFYQVTVVDNRGDVLVSGRQSFETGPGGFLYAGSEAGALQPV